MELTGDEPVSLYDPQEHTLLVLGVEGVRLRHRAADLVAGATGASVGTAILMFADTEKAQAAYVNWESLVLRDAGCLMSTLCLVAEWLDVAACPLGFMGDELAGPMGLPRPRFRGVGGVLLSVWAADAFEAGHAT
jgi:hypothetical protein